MSWYRVDITHVRKGLWNTYIRELGLPTMGTSERTAKENTLSLIVETTGDLNPQIVWNEC